MKGKVVSWFSKTSVRAIGAIFIIAGFTDPVSAGLVVDSVGKLALQVEEGEFYENWAEIQIDSLESYTRNMVMNERTLTNYGTLVTFRQFNNMGSATLNNFGTIENNSWLVNFNTLVNEGTLNTNNLMDNFDAATLVNTGMLNNTGRMNITNESTLVNEGTLNNTGSMFMTAVGESDLGGVVVNNGIIGRQLDGHAFTEVGGTINFTGELSGSGVVRADLVQISGSLSPGDSAGLLTFESDVAWMDGSTIVIELGGYERGESYDSFNITGNLLFETGVTLDIGLLDVFDPVFGDMFDLAYVMGDINGSFGSQPSGWLISVVDLVDDANGYQHALRLTFGGFDGSTVPEPGMMSLFGLGLLGMGLMRRRRSVPQTGKRLS